MCVFFSRLALLILEFWTAFSCCFPNRELHVKVFLVLVIPYWLHPMPFPFKFLWFPLYFSLSFLSLYLYLFLLCFFTVTCWLVFFPLSLDACLSFWDPFLFLSFFLFSEWWQQVKEIPSNQQLMWPLPCSAESQLLGALQVSLSSALSGHLQKMPC